MFGHSPRKLLIEKLENRRVLNGDGAGVLPPPPIDNNVALIDFFAPSRQLAANNFNSQIEVVENGFSASAVSTPTDNPAPTLTGGFNSDRVADFLSADTAGNWYCI